MSAFDFQDEIVLRENIATSLLSVVGAINSEPSKAKGLVIERLDDVEALVITKTRQGFDADIVKSMRAVVQDAAAGRLGSLKFLAIDFAHEREGAEDAVGVEGFDALVDEISNLILSAPVVSVACARGPMAGADMELALACSMLIASQDVNFSFGDDPTVSLGVYGLLAMKIGFVRTERLMESGEPIEAEQMQELMLVKEVGDGDAGMLHRFLGRTVRRHNSCYGIYRAQRISTQAVRDNIRA